MRGQAHFVELLSVARARTDDPQVAIILAIRPQPDRSWQWRNLGLTLNQARRLRDDLDDSPGG